MKCQNRKFTKFISLLKFPWLQYIGVMRWLKTCSTNETFIIKGPFEQPVIALFLYHPILKLQFCAHWKHWRFFFFPMPRTWSHAPKVLSPKESFSFKFIGRADHHNKDQISQWRCCWWCLEDKEVELIRKLPFETVGKWKTTDLCNFVSKICQRQCCLVVWSSQIKLLH